MKVHEVDRDGATASADSIPSLPSIDASGWHSIRRWMLLFMAASAWFSLTAWLRPLAIPDEGRYVGVAREMLLGDRWLVPTLDGLPFFHKPPLFYWLTAMSMKAFGIHAAAARLASILAAALATTALHAFVSRWQGAATARRVVLILVTMPLYYAGAQFANPDMLVAAFIAATVLSASHALLAQEAGASNLGALVAAFASAALGVLSKGLIGLVLPSGVLLAWALTTGRLTAVGKLALWWPGWIVFIVIASPWFVAVQAEYPGFAHYFIVVQHVQRFLSPSFNNGQPPTFYPAVLIVLALPWSPWLLAVVRRNYWGLRDPHGLRSLMACWLVVVTVFFSIPHSKLVGYILPALPPLAYLLADAWRHAAAAIAAGGGRFARFARFRTSLQLAGALCVSLMVAAHFLQPKSTAEIGRRIAAVRQPGEPVFFIGNPFFDLPFYAGIEQPPRIVDDWSAADLAGDTWRRALVDAAGFGSRTDPSLLKPDQLPRALCSSNGGWIVASASTKLPGMLSTAPPSFMLDGTAAWHMDRTACGKAE